MIFLYKTKIVLQDFWKENLVALHDQWPFPGSTAICALRGDPGWQLLERTHRINPCTWWVFGMHHIMRQGQQAVVLACADHVCFGLFVCVLGAITIYQCCAGNELHKQLKVDTSWDGRWVQVKTAHSSRVLHQSEEMRASRAKVGYRSIKLHVETREESFLTLDQVQPQAPFFLFKKLINIIQ